MRFDLEGLLIKVSGVTNEQDALLAIGLGANVIGFEMSSGPRQVSAQLVTEIVRRLPTGSQTVGVFRGDMPQYVVEVANNSGLSGVQIEGPVSVGALGYISERVRTVMRMAPSVAAGTSAAQECDYLLLPEGDSRQDLIEALDFMSEYDQFTPLIASGGLQVDNVVDVVQNYPVSGVDVRSGVESSIGVIDAGLMSDFIYNAKWAYDNSYVERRHGFFEQ
jgi:phosphoribosylanthranilate isomerase